MSGSRAAGEILISKKFDVADLNVSILSRLVAIKNYEKTYSSREGG